MTNEDRASEQAVEVLKQMRRKVAELETAETERRQIASELRTANRQLVREVIRRERTEQKLARQEARIRALYEVSARADIETSAQLEETLRIGTEALEMQMGVIGEVAGQVYSVRHVFAPQDHLKKGQTLDLLKTYSSMTLDTGGLVAIDDVQNSEYRGHPCYEAFKVQSHIGVPVYVNGEPIGTLSFSSMLPCRTPFDETDRNFVMLMGRWIGTRLERQKAKELLQTAHDRLEEEVKARTLELQAAVEQLSAELKQRESIENALRMSDERNRALLEAIPDAIFRLDKNGTYLDFIPAKGFETLLPPAEFLGKRVAEVLPPDLAEGSEDSIRRALQTGEVQTHEYTLEINGSTRHYESRIVVCSNDELLGLVRDITQRKETERKLQHSNLLLAKTLAELKQAHQRMSQQERLRALGQMASGIAHDLNNSLAPIMGFSEVLTRFPALLEDKAQALQYLDMIHTAARDAATVVKRLRDFYRPNDEDPAFDVVRLNDMIEKVGALTKPKWHDEALARGTTIQLLFDLADVPLVLGCESELREVMMNLVINAIDAIREDGQIRFQTATDGKDVSIEVSDTGCGMSGEEVRRCFDPFFTTKKERGAGLGLSIVFGTIQRHRGDITVSSKIGEGTTFTIRLPATDETATKQVEGEPRAIGRPLNILVVDDEPPVRETLEAFLKIDGHAVTSTPNGREGLLAFCQQPFHLVITDRAMPGINGDELARSVKKLSPQTPVVMITGFGDVMRGLGSNPPGVDEVLSKPITIHELREAVAKVQRSSSER